VTEQILPRYHLKRFADGIYSKADNFQPHDVTDGNLVTAQNPPFSAGAASAVIGLLG
jgi:putative intracellular protease/amidase